jgi:hypothetical protein
MRDLDVVHASKPYEERDADIVSASRILVAIPPYPEDDPRSSQSETWAMVRMGRAAGREIVYVPRPGRQDEPSSRNAVRAQTGVTAAEAKKVTWAVRQGRTDRKVGTVCRKYKHFLSTYNLRDSGLSLKMWTAYRQARQPAPAKAAHTCRRCRKPVSNGRERWGWLCEDCERPIISVSRPGDSSYRVPDGNSVRAVPAGLPGLGKRR